jgi:hypothetical protein
LWEFALPLLFPLSREQFILSYLGAILNHFLGLGTELPALTKRSSCSFVGVLILCEPVCVIDARSEFYFWADICECLVGQSVSNAGLFVNGQIP